MGNKDAQSSYRQVSHRWKLKRTVQCLKCPWRVETDPHEIPNGYSEEKHRAPDRTIAKASDGLRGPDSAMACHETDDAHCIGWLVNQLGPGNNIDMRIRMLTCENAHKIRLRGEQHKRFEDTLPRPRTMVAMTLDDARDFYDFLRGGPCPDGISVGSRPRLTANAAFSVLYVLQEKYRLVPDVFEKCCRCNELFDSGGSGYYDERTGRHYCDDHIPMKVLTK